MAVKWATVASELKKQYVENGRCKLCGDVLVTGKDLPFKVLRNIYRHFNEKHPEIVKELKEKLSKIRPIYAFDRVFPETEVKPEEKPIEAKAEEKKSEEKPKRRKK